MTTVYNVKESIKPIFKRSINSRAQISSAFDFQAFFSGRAGSVILLGLPGYSKAYTTDVGSTEVTAQYDPIGRVTDLSGNNKHWTQSVSAQRSFASLSPVTSLPILTSVAGDLKYLECDIPELTDVLGYTMITAGVVDLKIAGTSRITSTPFSYNWEGAYGDFAGGAKMCRGVSWYYESDITGIFDSTTDSVAIHEFQRLDRDNYAIIATNDVDAPLWTGPQLKAASRPYGYDGIFRTMHPETISANAYSFFHLIIEGTLTDEERTTLYTFLKTFKGGIVP